MWGNGQFSLLTVLYVDPNFKTSRLPRSSWSENLHSPGSKSSPLEVDKKVSFSCGWEEQKPSAMKSREQYQGLKIEMG